MLVDVMFVFKLYNLILGDDSEDEFFDFVLIEVLFFIFLILI